MLELNMYQNVLFITKKLLFFFFTRDRVKCSLADLPLPLHICKPHKKSIITKSEKQGDVSTRWDLPKINGKHKFKCKKYSKKEKCITQVMKPP